MGTFKLIPPLQDTGVFVTSSDAIFVELASEDITSSVVTNSSGYIFFFLSTVPLVPLVFLVSKSPFSKQFVQL
ncbi:MAG: hypothetical protein LDL41_15555, partial [Coleofasciculus sp. S288]|nr:hypothetical protein [Coleofasciculus sp. S288]